MATLRRSGPARVTVDPLTGAGYPDDVLEHVSRLVEPTFIQDGDERAAGEDIEQALILPTGLIVRDSA